MKTSTIIKINLLLEEALIDAAAEHKRVGDQLDIEIKGGDKERVQHWMKLTSSTGDDLAQTRAAYVDFMAQDWAAVEHIYPRRKTEDRTARVAADSIVSEVQEICDD